MFKKIEKKEKKDPVPLIIPCLALYPDMAPHPELTENNRTFQSSLPLSFSKLWLS